MDYIFEKGKFKESELESAIITFSINTNTTTMYREKQSNVNSKTY